GPGERDPGLEQPPQGVRARRPRRVQDGEVIPPRRAGRRGRAAVALPGVQPDVVVVPAGGNERRLPAPPLLDLEPEDAAVEGERPLQVADLEVDVPDADGRVDRARGVGHGVTPDSIGRPEGPRPWALS